MTIEYTPILRGRTLLEGVEGMGRILSSLVRWWLVEYLAMKDNVREEKAETSRVMSQGLQGFYLRKTSSGI